MIDLSIVIVNYNGGEFLRKALSSIFDHPPASLEFRVVVVDNASTDGSTTQAKAAFPTIMVIENNENLGFARANNIGIAWLPARHYLLLNSDTELTDNSVERLWNALAENRVAGIVGPLLVYPDGRDQKTARRFPTPAAALFGRKSVLTRRFGGNWFSRRYMPHLAPGPTGLCRVDWISGACLMIKDEVIRNIGLMDEKYFMYWEDADWCFQARAHGWHTYCLPSVKVLHHEGGSSKSMGNRLMWEFHKSIAYFVGKNYLRRTHSPLYFIAAGILYLRGCFMIGANVLRTTTAHAFCRRGRVHRWLPTHRKS